MPMCIPAPAMWVDGPIVVVDAAPAALPVAAASLLSREVPPPLVLDRAGCFASLPRRSDHFCRLPGVPSPTKNLLFAYLEPYAARFDTRSSTLFVYLEPYGAARFDIRPDAPDRADSVASPCPRSIYGLLHLHHRKDFSRLPGMPFRDHYSEHPTRKLLVTYLEVYAARFDIRPVVLDRVDCITSPRQRSASDQLPGKPFSDHYPEHPTKNLLVACRDACVARLDTSDQSASAVSARFDHAAGLWRVRTVLAENNASTFKEYIGRWIVVATDDNAEDIVPEFDGAEAIEGPVVDMSGEAYRGNLVAVISSGKAYCVKREFMLDLCDHNASLSMVILDSMRGLPPETTFSVAVFVLRFLRLWLVDNFLVVLASVLLGRLGELGMRPPSNGPQEQKNTKARTPVFDGGVLTRIPSCNIKIVSGIRRSSGAGLRHQSILMFLLITLLAGAASARPVNTSPVCPRGNFSSYLVQGHVCHIEALARVPSVPPTPPISRQVNFGCRYSENILLLLACLAPWYSIWNFQPNDGTYIQFFVWRRRHLHIWKYMAICSICFYMCIMLYGLARGDSYGMNIFLINGACGFVFVILLVFLMYRHMNFYEVTCDGVATIGACCTVALAFTFPIHLAIQYSFSPNTISMIFGILSIPLMVTMHTLRWFPLTTSCWFVVFDLFGITSGFLWLCNLDGDIIYRIIISFGVILRVIEVLTSVVWWCKGGNPLVRVEEVHDG